MDAPTSLDNSQAVQLIAFYHSGAEEDMETAEVLLQHSRFTPSLFFLHLALEKLIKSAVIHQRKEAPPFIHDLVRLSELSELNFSEDQKVLLRIINQFNLRAQYDDYKREFARTATRAYTHEHLEKGKALFVWINQSIQKMK